MRSFDESIRIFATPNAASLATELFRECFNAPFPVPRDNAGLTIPTPPENWRQYVAVYRWPDGTEETVGFCNWIRYEQVYLEGGMCVRKSFYRRLPKDQFRECSARGGVAQMMMEAAAKELDDCVAWFGFCGDKKALAADLRAGYELTDKRHLIVKWFRAPAPSGRQALIDRIAAIGPF